MKVPRHVVDARRNRLASLLEQYRYLPIQELCARLSISEATARRDLAALDAEGRIKRTYGGALTEFDDRFPSFRDRREHAASAKAKIAQAARSLIQPGGTYFLDTGTTIFALADEIRQNPIAGVTIVTSNLPVGELLSGVDGLQVFLTAGQIFHRQAVLLGEITRKSLGFWRFDGAFLCAEAMNSDGLWNSTEGIVAQQQTVLAQSRRSFFCIDASKLKKTAPVRLVPWSRVDVLVTEAAPAVLEKAGIAIGNRLLHAGKPLKGGSPAFDSGIADERENGDLPVHFL